MSLCSLFGIRKLTACVALLFAAASSGALAGDATSDRYVEEDSWWAERAAAFFPRYHFTLQVTSFPSVSRDSGGAGTGDSFTMDRPVMDLPVNPDAILADQTWSGGAGGSN